MINDNIELIHDATSVKKAVLVHHIDTKTYSLIHYDTEILAFNEDLEISKALRCSPTSTKAINQVADHFGLNKTLIQKKMVQYTGFYKYPVGN